MSMDHTGNKKKNKRMEGAWKGEPRKLALFRHRVFNIIEVGYNEDFIGRGYDVVNLFAIIVNILISILLTFDSIVERYSGILYAVEAVTVAFFAFDYLLRLITSSFLFPEKKPLVALFRYMISFNGIVDILSFLPYYLPVFFPAGAVAFRMFRVMRIFRIFRINAYYDSLNVITDVIKSKAKQLLSSMFVLLMLMLAASLCMYSVEHPAQPEVFKNALSGVWWASATLLTVGYGDIYPITAAGKVLGTIITFLGVGVAAIPTGIISAGFVEQYSKLQGMGRSDGVLQFIRVRIEEKDEWAGREIAALDLPEGVIVAAVLRNGEMQVPRGDIVIQKGDILVLGAEAYNDGFEVTLNEVKLDAAHEWSGQKIKDLDISRQSFIVSVKRRGKALVPGGDLKLLSGDIVIMYTKKNKLI